MARKKSKKYKIAEAVSIIAHHLKNPIAIIKGYLESLIVGDCGEVNQEQKEYLNDALTNVKEMSKTINDLIDISRIEEGEYKLNFKLVSLEEISFQVLSDFFHWAKASNCKIIFKKPKKLPQVLTDPNKIKYVIENIISNAIKYNLGRGVIEVSVLLKQTKKEILFSCKDNGIGIPEEDYKKVFSKFYRSEKALEIDPSGSGLGLYVNKAIVELSGGKIWFVKNKTGKGMTFNFSLPITKTKKSK
jgi:two-component system phosphate regulon sensor histidine kinase PhoR